MANDILKIRDIGAKEVSKHTHIEVEYLEDMCDKNFDKLKKLNAIGFVKILSREYGWDLSDWTEEFRTYCLEHPGDCDSMFGIMPKIPAYTSTNSSGGSWILVAIVVLVLCGFIWLFSFTKYFGGISFFDDKNQSVTYSTSPVVEDAKENLKIETSIITGLDKSAADANITDINISTPINKATQTIERQITDKTEENITSSQVGDILKTSKPNLEINSKPNLSATIHPKQKIWIGIKYLDTNEKNSKITSEPFNINLNKNALILTGHGGIILELEDQNKSYDLKNPLRFLIQNGEIKQVDYDEYIKLNKGKEW